MAPVLVPAGLPAAALVLGAASAKSLATPARLPAVALVLAAAANPADPAEQGEAEHLINNSPKGPKFM